MLAVFILALMFFWVWAWCYGEKRPIIMTIALLALIGLGAML